MDNSLYYHFFLLISLHVLPYGVEQMLDCLFLQSNFTNLCVAVVFLPETSSWFFLCIERLKCAEVMMCVSD